MNRSFIVVGDETLTTECLARLLDAGHSVELVVSRSSQVERWADEHSLQHRKSLAGSLPNCDYVLSAANLRMLPEAFLQAPRIAAINFHDGPLPRYAGLNAPVWALLEGTRSYGISWHLMTAEPDTGDIVEQELFELDAEETALSLNTRCFEAGVAAFERLLPRLASSELGARPQELSLRSYYELGRPLPNGGVIDPSGSAEEVVRLVRALDFGHYANPVASAWLANQEGGVRVASAEARDGGVSSPVGTVRVDNGGLALQCAEGTVVLSGLTMADGQPLTPVAALARLHLSDGSVIRPSKWWLADAARLSGASGMSEGRTIAALRDASPELPFLRNDPPAASGIGQAPSRITPTASETLVAALGTFIAQLTSAEARVWVATTDSVKDTALHRELFDPFVPVRFPLGGSAMSATKRARRALSEGPVSQDLTARHPLRLSLAGDRIGIDFSGTATGAFDLLLSCLEAQPATWTYSRERFRETDIASFDAAFANFLEGFTSEGSSASLIAPTQADTLSRWNATSIGFDRTGTVVSSFEALVDRQPDAIALVGGGESLTYRELDERANRLAQHLVSLGAGPDQLVGVHMERSLDLVVALIATLKSGAAYVPVDPAYPEARKALMIEDSGARIVLSDRKLAVPDAVRVTAISDASETTERLPLRAKAEDLAYVIYTSGSTGRPKGVMLEHRNVVNFFHGMDDRIEKDPGTWLAVTSISFDISVLELLWTLTRGFTIVVNGALSRRDASLPSLSVFFFGSDPGPASYQLLMDAARFADVNGFEAVWTPERHFHAFGGAFPNPSVTSAALAAATNNVSVRAGSCVLPLHSPVRVAEEWAFVDQISRGRVGISFATGWQPNDFVINPAGYGFAKDELVAGIRKVQALWRGDSLELPGHDGAPVAVVTLPRPVQKELPAWLTSAGDPETFRLAGEQGLNLLTHLLGQSMSELERKIQIYRDAWRQAGHPGAGQVTLMLHSYVSDSDDDARETVREPMIAYLGSSVGLIKQFATSFPTFKNASSSDGDLLQSLSPEGLRELLEVAFERYYETSGLFGDAKRATAMLRDARAIGVDEVACLLDFGIEHSLVMQSLERIAALRETDSADHIHGATIPELIERHGATHFQCTPSMAGMLAADPDFQHAARRLKVMMVGGEAFPVDLADQLAGMLGGRLLNMYGPTETTIWSTTSEIQRGSKSVSIGTPIANTAIYILGPERQSLPPGAVGELWIGGEGVARGYLGREDLTAERFLPDPFASKIGARMYRTGDLARFEPDGTLTFLGRIDQQVKVRGYRIEPGEIEAIVRSNEAITEAVVVAREDTPGDQRLVCYYASNSAIDELALRDSIGRQLPAYMVPTNFVRLDALPLTPNKKVDRKALPAPGDCSIEEAPAAAQPVPETAAHISASASAGETLRLVVDSWTDVLRTPNLPRNRTFFDCGGNSLLLLQLHKRLLPHHPSLKLTDLFRHPTIDSLASYLGDNVDSTPETDDVSRRALARRSALGRRPVHA